MILSALLINLVSIFQSSDSCILVRVCFLQIHYYSYLLFTQPNGRSFLDVSEDEVIHAVRKENIKQPVDTEKKNEKVSYGYEMTMSKFSACYFNS